VLAAIEEEKPLLRTSGFAVVKPLKALLFGCSWCWWWSKGEGF
jgi:hypothetical protein